jgi:Tol biopolymer transport system component
MLGKGRRLPGMLAAAGIGCIVVGTFTPDVAQAAFPGQDGTIVYVSDTTASTPYCSEAYQGNELFLVSPSGGTPSQLTCTGQQDSHPFISPDGTQVVFSSTRAGGSPMLYTVPISSASDGSAVSPTLISVVPPGATSVTDDYPSWSPSDDGTIVFQRTINGGTPQLWTENVNDPGMTAAPVFSSPTGYSDTEPVYDPLDPDIIVFVRSIGGDTQIFSYDTATPSTAPLNLSAAGDGGSPSNDSKPDFAPNQGPNGDGQRIIFESDRACGMTQLYTMRDDGTNQVAVFQQLDDGVPDGVQQCTGQADENPVYSPQADAIAYDRPGPNSQDIYDSYYVPLERMSAAASAPTDLTNDYATDEEPNWGPILPAAATPEVPLPLVLPLTGAGLLAGGVVLGRRRSVKRTPLKTSVNIGGR